MRIGAGRTEAVGERIRRLREAKGLSQRRLAGPGVSAAYICHLEAGRRTPSVRALRVLADKLGVTVDFLETGFRSAAERECDLSDTELELALADPASAEARFQELLAESVQAEDETNAARARAGIVLCAVEQGDYSRAVGAFEDFAGEELPAVSERPELYAAAGRAYGAVGETVHALRLLRRCLDQVRGLDPPNPALFVRFATYLSYALTDNGDDAGAQAVLSEALGYADELEEDPHSRVRLYWSLARMYAARGHSDLGVKYVRRAIALLELTEERLQLAMAHESCAHVLLNDGQPAEARRHLETATAIYREHAEQALMASAMTEWARYHLQQGSLDQARRVALDALDLLENVEAAARENIGDAWRTLALVLAATDEDELAERAFHTAIAELAHAPVPQLAAAHREYGEFLHQRARQDEAFEAMRRAANLLSTARAPAPPTEGGTRIGEATG